MKKRMKLLALALAVVMLLPTAALAAENEEEGPVLVCDGLDWDEGHFVHEEDLTAKEDWDRSIGLCPGQEHAVMFSVLDNGKKTPVIPQGDGNVSVRALRWDEIASDAKQSKYYVCVSMAEFKDGSLTAEYNGETLTFPVAAELPDVALYSKPEASPENYLSVWNYTPTVDDTRTAYAIATHTDEDNGRHMTEMALSKDWPDNEKVTLEKVSDNVYKMTLKDIDMVDLHPHVDVTWQEVQFLGGNTYTDTDRDFYACEWASTLVTGLDMTEFDMSTPTLYQDATDDFKNTLTLKAGESKTVHIAFTNYATGGTGWTIKRYGTDTYKVSGENLKLTPGEDTLMQLTISCDVPGTYTFAVDGSWWNGVVTARYKADGKPYSEAELRKWDAETTYFSDGDNGKLMIVTDEENWDYAPYEEVYPGETYDYSTWLERDVWAPVTVTVESAAPAFTDVKEGDWYAPAVSFVNGKGYMSGSNSKFNPEGKITGAEFSQLLYNKAGKPAAAEGASFQGVAGAWYESAMLWAAGEGIISDTGDAAVQPEKELTRQQLAVMLYNSLGKPEGTAGLAAFSDADQIGDWAKAAMEWAVSAKVFNGDGGKLNPAGSATRAEVAQMLLNYFGK